MIAPFPYFGYNRNNMGNVERFWSKVAKSDGCWIWTASKRSKGYGAFCYVRDGEMVHGRAHRFSWELHYGPIPSGLCVLHRCDNPACVRPDHLWLGTKADNNADMKAKGRKVPGGTYGPGRYKRGPDWYAAHGLPAHSFDIAEVRHDRSRGLSFPAIASKHGISVSHASRICNGGARKWQ